MAQTATSVKAPKEPPDAPPAQAPTHARPRTAGRHHVAQLPTRSPSQRLHASASMQLGTRLTHATRLRRQAPTPLTHAGVQAPAAHPRRTSALRTHERPEHACLGTHPVRLRKQASLHSAAERVRRRQQDRGQCTWHGIGRLSRRRHGDRTPRRGPPCGALFLVLSHFCRIDDEPRVHGSTALNPPRPLGARTLTQYLQIETPKCPHGTW
jgi:hypothetical protein